MTTIVIEKSQDGSYRGFTCMGHAGYAKKGVPDVLCSAISALSIHTVNGLKIAAGQELEISTNEETAFIRCIIKDTPGEGARCLMKAFEYSIRELSKQYGEKFLLIQFKEVKDNA